MMHRDRTCLRARYEYCSGIVPPGGKSTEHTYTYSVQCVQLRILCPPAGIFRVPTHILCACKIENHKLSFWSLSAGKRVTH